MALRKNGLAVACAVGVIVALVVVALVVAVYVRSVRSAGGRRAKFFNECRLNKHADHRFCHPRRALTDVHATLRSIYGEFMRVCGSAGVRPVLQAGGLIGWHFNGRMLPWDDDLDVFIFEEDVPKILKIDGYRSPSCIIEINPNHTVRREREDPDNVIDARVISPVSGDFIDVGFLFPCPRDAQYLASKPERDRFLARTMYPPKRAKFEGIDVFVPARPSDYLVARYGRGVLRPAYKEWVFDGAAWVKRR